LDGSPPFQQTPGERTEIRNIFKIISSGGNPYTNPEIKSIFPKYKIIFDIFDFCMDVRYGNFIHLPFSGGALEQPSKTMDCLKYLQFLFREKIAEEERKKNTFRR
jgi:hypothetical protein